MSCVGHENKLSECEKSEYLQFTCPRSQIAGVLCGEGRLTVITFKRQFPLYQIVQMAMFVLVAAPKARKGPLKSVLITYGAL